MTGLPEAMPEEAEIADSIAEDTSPMNVVAQDIQDLLDPEPTLDEE